MSIPWAALGGFGKVRRSDGGKYAIDRCIVCCVCLYGLKSLEGAKKELSSVEEVCKRPTPPLNKKPLVWSRWKEDDIGRIHLLREKKQERNRGWPTFGTIGAWLRTRTGKKWCPSFGGLLRGVAHYSAPEDRSPIQGRGTLGERASAPVGRQGRRGWRGGPGRELEGDAGGQEPGGHEAGEAARPTVERVVHGPGPPMARGDTLGARVGKGSKGTGVESQWIRECGHRGVRKQLLSRRARWRIPPPLSSHGDRAHWLKANCRATTSSPPLLGGEPRSEEKKAPAVLRFPFSCGSPWRTPLPGG